MKWFLYLSTGIVLLTGTKVVAANDHFALQHCVQIKRDSARLECFDEYAKSVITSQKPAQVTVKQKNEQDKDTNQRVKPQPTTVAGQSSDQTAKRDGTAVKDFGLESRRKSDKEEVEEVTSKIVKLSKDRRGKLMITLENGMIWQQKNEDYFRAETGDKATVSRGFFGVFYLGVEDSNRRTKVKRVE